MDVKPGALSPRHQPARNSDGGEDERIAVCIGQALIVADLDPAFATVVDYGGRRQSAASFST
jgi:hypothetical protein